MKPTNQIIWGTLTVLVLLLAVIGLFKTTNTQENQQSTFDTIMQTHELHACYIPWPPSVIKDADSGNLSGFIIDIAQEIANDANLKLTYIQSTWGGFPADLNTGKCDVVFAGLYPTIGRSTDVSFTQPFFYAGNSGVVKTGDTRFQTIADLNNEDITVAVVQGDFDHIYAQKHLPKAHLLVLDKASDDTMSLVAVSSGKADVGLSSSDVVARYAREHPEVSGLFLDKPFSTSPVTFAVRQKDQELLNFLNNALGYLKATGFLDGTIKKYGSVLLKIL